MVGKFPFKGVGGGGKLALPGMKTLTFQPRIRHCKVLRSVGFLLLGPSQFPRKFLRVESFSFLEGVGGGRWNNDNHKTN